MARKTDKTRETMSKKTTVYIASSWKNEHAVVMLADVLRGIGCEVKSFVEKATHVERGLPFDKWVWTDDAGEKFEFDTS